MHSITCGLHLLEYCENWYDVAEGVDNEERELNDDEEEEEEEEEEEDDDDEIEDDIAEDEFNAYDELDLVN